MPPSVGQNPHNRYRMDGRGDRAGWDGRRLPRLETVLHIDVVTKWNRIVPPAPVPQFIYRAFLGGRFCG